MRIAMIVCGAVAAAMAGCAGAWEEHYEGSRLNSLASDAPVKLVASRAIEVEKGESAGFVRLGKSEFEQQVDAGEGSLEAFARSIGAPLVWFSIEDKGERTRRVRKAEYVPSGTQGGGSYVDADGAVRGIDSMNNYMYVEVEREVTERVWKHSAVFFAPTETGAAR